MKQFSLFFLLLLVTFSCSKNTSEEEIEAVVVTDDFKSYRLDMDLPVERFSDLIESVELVRMEETDNSLLSYIYAIDHTKGELVFTSGREDDVFVFDSKGNFVRKINRKGEGPEEYLNITDLWLEGDTLAIYSMNKSTVMRYNLEGDFIRSERLPASPGHVLSYNKGYAMDMNYRPINDTSRYRYATLDRNLKPNGMYLPVDNRMAIGISLSTNSVAPYKNGVILHRAMSDTVHYMSDKGFTPLLHLNFGNDWYWKESRDVTEQFVSEMGNTEKVWSADAKIGANRIWVLPYTGSVEGRVSPNFFIDRGAGTVHNVDMRKADKSNSVAIALRWDNEQMIFTIQSPDVASFLSELNEDQIKFRPSTTLEEIESSENPVLMWVKFK
ncbi:6-bladed beta-propeller [Roseivirga sp.]|uniref:6-bladed beta-propeller n=1 Tax=Roseivirga sp. TaxID=1964215 RepID=UPI002B264F3A|nr:6-bladed beta-propeller [Roseivirga sp.]